MGKVRYKSPSENFEKNSLKASDSSLRASIGRDGSVKEYYYISLQNLIPYTKQARRIFDENELLQMAETIKSHGIASPLTVIASQEFEGKFEVVSGERRLRASILAGLEKVPCIIIKEEERAEEIALIENIQRADLHPIEFADALASLLERKDWGDVSKLALKIGKSQPTVSEHLSYAKLPKKIKDFLVERNTRSRDVLRKLISSESQEEMEVILGLRASSPKKYQKNVLRVFLSDQGVHIQDRQLKKLGKEEKNILKSALLDLIKKLEY